MDHLAYDNVESDIVSVTFREGMTQRQIGELLEENKVCTADEFYQALDEGDYSSYDFAGLVPDDDRCALESMRDISSRTPMNFIPI